MVQNELQVKTNFVEFFRFFRECLSKGNSYGSSRNVIAKNREGKHRKEKVVLRYK